MFTAYNKNNAKNALVGNWVEEDALRANTGYNRRRVPAPYYTPEMKESRREFTSERVLTHPRSSESGSGPETPAFETTNQANMRYGDFAVTHEPPGARATRRDMELLEQAKRICEHQEQHRLMVLASEIPIGTVASSSYLPLDPVMLANSTRVPRGRNGACPAVDPAIQHLTKQQVDSIDQMKLELLQGNTVTRYSYAVATGVGLNFATTASDSTNPFGRSSAFTNEITDVTKRHGEATEPGSMIDERVGANVHQRSALKRLVAAVEQDPSTTTQFAETLARKSQSEFIQISDFRATWSETLNSASKSGSSSAWKGLTDRDAIHIFMYFDTRSIGAIHLPEFLDFCFGGSQQQQQSTASVSGSARS